MHPPVSKLSDHQEMYLKAVCVLSKEHTVARVKDIAKYLGVTKPSVSSALKNLSEKGLVVYDPYSFATLTPKGDALAEELLNKYGILADFLTEILHVPEELADENACRMEHAVDDFVMERLVQFLKFFKACDVTFNVGSPAAQKPATTTKIKSAKRTAPRKKPEVVLKKAS